MAGDVLVPSQLQPPLIPPPTPEYSQAPTILKFKNYLGGLGPFGSKFHDKEVSRAYELEQNYRQLLSPRFTETVEDERLYLSKKLDSRRGKEKKWRADVQVPYPYSMVETISSVMNDIMSGPDPTIQVEGVGQEDKDLAAGVERLFEATLRANKWPLQRAMTFRTAPVEGQTVLKLGWIEKRRNMLLRATPQEVAEFKQSVARAVEQGAPPPPQDPAQFEQWRQDINLVKQYGEVPAPPVMGWRTMTEYCGPHISRVPIWDLRFQPNIDSTGQLPWILQRVVMSKRAVLALAGPEPNKPWDLDQVNAALTGWDGKTMESFQEEVAEMMGIRTAAQVDRYSDESCELWEVWEPDSDFPFKIILNRKAVINKRPSEMLYAHGHTPYHFVRNIPIANQWLGMSEYQQSRRLFHEMNMLRSLKLDAVTLQVLPIFMKLKDLGMTEAMKSISPGMVIDVARPDGIKQLLDLHPDINDAFREIQSLKEDIDETSATQPQVRGSQGTVGRITGTEFAGRLNQALVRTKDRVVRAEEELSNIPPDAMMLWYQFGDPKTIVKASGNQAMVEIPRDKFLEFLQYDIRFRGAAKVLNKDMFVQQMQSVLEIMTKTNLGTVAEKRECMVRMLEAMGQKGVQDIVTAAGTAQLEAIEKVQVAMQLGMLAPPGQPGEPGAPGTGGPPQPGGGPLDPGQPPTHPGPPPSGPDGGADSGGGDSK
jgi:hypothetical protein